MRSSVESLRAEALGLAARPGLSGHSELPPEQRKRAGELRTAVIEATIAEHEYLNSLLARPLSEQDRDQIVKVLEQEWVDSGNSRESTPGFEHESDWRLFADFQEWLVACEDSIPGEMMVVELDWATDESSAKEELGDLWAQDLFGRVTADELGLGVLTLADHGPAGGWPVLMFWGPRDAVIRLLEGYDADPSLDYSAARPACRACGWSQVGSVYVIDCPYCGRALDWVV